MINFSLFCLNYLIKWQHPVSGRILETFLSWSCTQKNLWWLWQDFWRHRVTCILRSFDKMTRCVQRDMTYSTSNCGSVFERDSRQSKALGDSQLSWWSCNGNDKKKKKGQCHLFISFFMLVCISLTINWIQQS